MGHVRHHRRSRARREGRRRFDPVLVVVMVGLLLASACGDGDEDGSTSRATGPTPPTIPAPTTSRPPVVATASADLAGTDVTVTTVASGLDMPMQVLWRPGDPRMYVIEFGGRVVIIDESGRPLGTPVVAVPVLHDGTRGLFSAVFSPDGAKLYVLYTSANGDLHLDEFTMEGDVAGEGRTLLDQHMAYPNHNAGNLAFGPDGMLYISIGDGGGAGDPLGNAQELGVVLGKVLRISPAPVGDAPYAVPADNPFVGRDGARWEIWMYGLRNPWRFSFDLDGTMWLGDAGEDSYDEVNVASLEEAAGANWGWNLREGRHRFRGDPPPGAREPVIELPHQGTRNCSVIAGYLYRGSAIPALEGAFVRGDACNPDIIASVVVDGEVQEERTLAQVRGVISFGQDPDGELYVTSATGTVERLDAAGS